MSAAMRALNEYINRTYDPFRLKAAIEAATAVHLSESVGEGSEALRSLRSSSRSLHGVCQLAVENDWEEMFRGVPWWQRGRVRRERPVWVRWRMDARTYEAREEVASIAAESGVREGVVCWVGWY